MSADRRFIDLIEAIPGWEGPVFNTLIPQDPETEPTSLPFTVVIRSASEWITTLCGTASDRCFQTLQVQFAARQLHAARQMAVAAKAVLVPEADALESEDNQYDPELRAHYVTQTYRVFDVTPNQ